ATQAQTINPAAPGKVVFVTAPQTLVAGACSAALGIQTQDNFGNASNVASSILVTLASTSPLGSFYADASCNSQIAAVTVVVGNNSASFYYQDTRSGLPNASATSAPLSPGSQTETINPDLPAKLVFTTAPQTLSAGACSGSTTVQTQDAYGNPSPI